MTTALTILAWWMAASFIAAAAWALARAKGWIGFSETRPPCGDASWSPAGSCTEPEGHDGTHHDARIGVSWTRTPSSAWTTPRDRT